MKNSFSFIFCFIVTITYSQNTLNVGGWSTDGLAGGIEFRNIRDIGAQRDEMRWFAACGLQHADDIAKRPPPLCAGIRSLRDVRLSRLLADLSRNADASGPGSDHGVREAARPRPAFRQDRCVGDV